MTQAFARRLDKHVPSTRDVVLRAVLAVAFLIPAAILFGQVAEVKSTTFAAVDRELDGLAYLRAMTPVTTALTAAESVAVSGGDVDFGAVDRAMLDLQAVDEVNHASPGAHSRFVDLNVKVQQLHTLRPIGVMDAFNSYSEVTGLLLALAQEARQESGLIRDQSADAYYLEDGASWQLPNSIVYTGQYGDLLTIAIGQTPSQRQVAIGEIAAARASILASAQTLGDDVRLAVDATPSQTLSGDLLAKLDRFRLAVNALVPPTSMPNELPSGADHDLMLADKVEVQDAATDLSSAMITATRDLLNDRVGKVSLDQWLAVLTFVLACLVALTPMTVTLVTRRRRRRAFRGRGSGLPTDPDPHLDAGAGAGAGPEASRGGQSGGARELSGAAR